MMRAWVAGRCIGCSENQFDGMLMLSSPRTRYPLSHRISASRNVQVPEMPRDGGLRQPEQLDQVADAQFAGHEQVEDAEAGRIGEAAEQEIEIRDRFGGARCHAGSRTLVSGCNLARRI